MPLKFVFKVNSTFEFDYQGLIPVLVLGLDADVDHDDPASQFFEGLLRQLYVLPPRCEDLVLVVKVAT